jgi:hypothetical protein
MAVDRGDYFGLTSLPVGDSELAPLRLKVRLSLAFLERCRLFWIN